MNNNNRNIKLYVLLKILHKFINFLEEVENDKINQITLKYNKGEYMRLVRSVGWAAGPRV